MSSVDDYFLKDVRFAAGWTVPCGSKVVDLRSPRQPSVSRPDRSQGRAPQARTASASGQGRAPWFEHAHRVAVSRRVQTRPGWAHLPVRRLAAAQAHGCRGGHRLRLVLRPPARGRSARGWRYLRQRPLERGAISLRGHTSEFDIKNATAKSPTRRRLYEAGEYLPVAHRMVWLTARHPALGGDGPTSRRLNLRRSWAVTRSQSPPPAQARHQLELGPDPPCRVPVETDPVPDAAGASVQVESRLRQEQRRCAQIRGGPARPSEWRPRGGRRGS